ncbi:MAG: CBS domain-containing protein [Cytophagales bacterium]|nr:MAG: CBS domain-containing protein [Cytophagales bacterium]
MTAEELINQMIPPLKTTDSLEKALKWMEELKISQLPVVENNQYKGLVSEELIFAKTDNQHIVADLPLIAPEVKAYYHQHFYEILKLANSHAVEVVAIMDEANQFLGVVTVNDTLVAFADSTALQEPGGILVLLLDPRDYSLSEISRLIESNNAKILSTYINQNSQDKNKINVTIKTNVLDLSRIIATFERFGYQIIAKFQTNDSVDTDKERLEMLLKYLNI